MSACNPTVTTKSNILDVQVPKEMEKNISVGMEHIDLLFAGDGITPGTVALITGEPGTGKTTLMLQIADSITRTGGVCLFNTNEESLYQIRKVVRRLDIKHGFIPACNAMVPDILKLADKARAENKGKRFVLIVDSLQVLEMPKEKRRGRPSGSQNTALQAISALTDWAKQTYVPVLVVGQVNKDGVFAGKQEIKHKVDVHLHMHVDKDRKSDSYGTRVAEMQKNRFGAAGVYYPFDINASGIEFKI